MLILPILPCTLLPLYFLCMIHTAPVVCIFIIRLKILCARSDDNSEYSTFLALKKAANPTNFRLVPSLGEHIMSPTAL